MKKEEKNLFGLMGAGLLFFIGNSFWWHSATVDIFCSLLLLISLSVLWRNVCSLVFKMKRRSIITALFGLLCTVLLLSFVSSIFVVWYTLLPSHIWVVYSFVICISIIFSFFSERNVNKKIDRPKSFEIPEIQMRLPIFFSGRLIPLMVYGILWGVCFYFLLISNSTESLFSPWQTISEYFFPFFFFSTILLGFFLLSKYKIKTVLFILIAHSFLLHSYLPLSHAQPWGGDVWRHMAIEQQMVDGDFELPVLFGERVQWREVAGVDLPEALVIPHKYVYGQLWGTTLFFHYTFHFDLKTLNIWLGPILWSLFLPLILFYIGRSLFGSWRKSLWLVYFSFVPFSFQAVGSLSLPVSLGYLTFFFVLMLWLRYVESGRVWQKRIALLFASLMLFGYTLHFLLIWFVILVSYIVRLLFQKKKKALSYIGFSGLLLISIFFLPILEIMGRTSSFPSTWNWIEQGKQLIGQFSGWYFASGIRPHDILSGNILFNHTPDYAFASGLFSDSRWHVLVGMVVFIALAKFGFWKVIKRKEILLRTFVYFSMSIVFGYVLGWFVLIGDRSFVRRLDVMLAFVMLVLLLYKVGSISTFKKKTQLFLTLCSLLFVSWFAMTSFASGPDMRVVSQDEFDVAQYVWDSIDTEKEYQCVLADTWILLPLETLSAQKIVGGGFPIDAQFGQQDRVHFLEETPRDPSKNVLKEMHRLTKAEACTIVFSSKNIDQSAQDTLTSLTSSTPKQIGSFLVWNTELKTLE